MKNYELTINIASDVFTLELLDHKKVVGVLSKPYFRNLDNVLIGSIDKLLKRNRLNKSLLARSKVNTSSGSSATSGLLALSVAGGLNFRHIK